MTLLKNHVLTDSSQCSSTCRFPGMQKVFLPSNRKRFQIDALELTKLGLKLTKVDSNLWYKQHKWGHYEDNILVFAKEPMAIMNELEKMYVIKRSGIP